MHFTSERLAFYRLADKNLVFRQAVTSLPAVTYLPSIIHCLYFDKERLVLPVRLLLFKATIGLVANTDVAKRCSIESKPTFVCYVASFRVMEDNSGIDSFLDSCDMVYRYFSKHEDLYY